MNNPFDSGCPSCGQSAGFVQAPAASAADVGQAGMFPQNMAPQPQPGYYYTGTYVSPNPTRPAIQVPGTLTQQPTNTLGGGVAPSGPLTGSTQPITPLTQPTPVTTDSIQYLNAYLRTQIGQKVTVDFLIGTNTLVDRTGTLLGVGANYILINELETDDITVCDFFTIKFVRIYG